MNILDLPEDILKKIETKVKELHIKDKIQNRKIVKEKIQKADQTRNIANLWKSICDKLFEKVHFQKYCQKIDIQTICVKNMKNKLEQSLLKPFIRDFIVCIGGREPYLEVYFNNQLKPIYIYP